MMFFIKIFFLLFTVIVTVNGNEFENYTCPDLCDPNSCSVPDNECLAGLVKDYCDCCLVCARREGERCFDEAFRDDLPDDYLQYPKCGDNLQCRLRTDLEPTDRPEAICYCTLEEPICASDGNTYENQCQFTEARYQNRKLFEVDNQPCKTRPQIISPPEDITNNTGSSVSLYCEAMGWPLPTIDWKVERDGNEILILADETHFEIKSNSSSNYVTISWLQIMDAKREDSGVYICLANNTEGEQRASAYLTIGNFQKRFDLIED